MKKHLLLAALVCVVTGTAAAQTLSPNEILNSDEVLDEARRDVAKMDLDELRLFADSLAQCTHSLSEDTLIQNACDVARERYAIEYGRERALDELLSAIQIVAMVIRTTERVGEKTDADTLVRYVDVTRGLTDAANRAFFVLRMVSEPN